MCVCMCVCVFVLSKDTSEGSHYKSHPGIGFSYVDFRSWGSSILYLGMGIGPGLVYYIVVWV